MIQYIKLTWENQNDKIYLRLIDREVHSKGFFFLLNVVLIGREVSVNNTYLLVSDVNIFYTTVQVGENKIDFVTVSCTSTLTLCK